MSLVVAAGLCAVAIPLKAREDPSGGAASGRMPERASSTAAPSGTRRPSSRSSADGPPKSISQEELRKLQDEILKSHDEMLKSQDEQLKKSTEDLVKRLRENHLEIPRLKIDPVDIDIPDDALAPSPGQRAVVVYVIDSGSGRSALDVMVGARVSHGLLVEDVIKQFCQKAFVRVRAVFDSQGRFDGAKYFDALEAIASFAKRHSDCAILVNISLGSAGVNSRERELIGKLIDKGVVIVAAAGNENTDSPSYPAGYEGVVAVAASNGTGTKKDAASSYGRHVSLVARAKTEFTENVPRTLAQRQVSASGTSFAAPKVTGVLAEMLLRNADLTPGEAVAIVKRTAMSMPDEPLFKQGLLGAGVLDSYSAISAADPGYAWETWGPILGICALIAASSVFFTRRCGLLAGLMASLFLWVFIVPIFAGSVYMIYRGSMASGVGMLLLALVMISMFVFFVIAGDRRREAATAADGDDSYTPPDEFL